MAAMIPLTAALLIALGAAPALADGPPVTEVVEVVFVDVNPCTGGEHTQYVVFTDRVHIFDIEGANRSHGNFHGSLEGTTSDGFSGTAVGPAALNYTGEFGEDGTAIFAELYNGVLTNPDTGQRLRVHQRWHLVVVNGTVVVDNFTSVTACLGSKGGG